MTQVSVGNQTTCAVASGHLYCFGRNTSDQLADGTATTSSTPAEVVGPTGTGVLSTVSGVSVGSYYTVCARTSAADLYCWGFDGSGQLGDDTTWNITASHPIEVVDPTDTGYLATVSAVSVGDQTTCAVTAAGVLYCFGSNTSGQLGDGTTTGSKVPVEVGGSGSSTTTGTGTGTGTSEATQVSYTYNGDGLLAAVTTGGTKETLTWNPNTPSGDPELLVAGTDDYVYGPTGLPLEQVEGTTVLYYVHDQLGSTRLLTNASGTVAATFTYGPYGQLTGSTGSVTTPFGFAGAYTDAASGLLYLVNRWYTPASAQFLSVDPDISATDQPYAYTTDDPVNTTDPSGDVVTTGGGWRHVLPHIPGVHGCRGRRVGKEGRYGGREVPAVSRARCTRVVACRIDRGPCHVRDGQNRGQDGYDACRSTTRGHCRQRCNRRGEILRGFYRADLLEAVHCSTQ